jgi:phosphoglycerol transferase MdoB-like AlkP superfamily enzyme
MNTEKTPPQAARINIGTTKDLETVSELYLTSLPQDVISTTEDKLRLTLGEYLKKTEKKKGWITPLGLMISFTLTLMTSAFKDLGLSAATWKAIFIIAVIAAFVWLVYSVIGAFQSVKIDNVISELRKHSDSMIKFVKR